MNTWWCINRNVMTTLGLVLPGGNPDVRTRFADLTKEMLFEWGKQRYFRRTLRDNEKHSEDFRLKLNWTSLYATNFLIELSVFCHLNERKPLWPELIFLRLAEWRVCFECSSGDEHAFICVSSSGVSQWPHFNGLQQHFNPSKPVKAADLIKYCQWCMSFFLNRQT